MNKFKYVENSQTNSKKLRKRSIQVNSIFNPFHTEYFFDILVLHEYWVLTENKIPLKPVLGGVRIVALPISSHEQTQ